MATHRLGLVMHGVTAQTWQSHPEFYREVLSCLQQPVGANA